MTSAQPRGMSDPITTGPPEELELISSGGDFREFVYDLEKHRLQVVGYSTAEVEELLRLYREHFTELHEMAARFGRLMEAGR